MKLTIPLRLVNETNTREHWRVLAKRKATQRMLVGFAMVDAARASGDSIATARRVLVKLTRIYTRKKMDEHDNLPASFKHVVDAIAGWFGTDDGSDFYTWKYAQERGDEYGVRIEIEGQ